MPEIQRPHTWAESLLWSWEVNGNRGYRGGAVLTGPRDRAERYGHIIVCCLGHYLDIWSRMVAGKMGVGLGHQRGVSEISPSCAIGFCLH